MKTNEAKNKLRDLIMNNPRAKERIEIKEIEKQIKNSDKKFIINNRSDYAF